MLLSSIGESVSPAYLAAISGCGLGAFFDQRSNWLYFNFALPNEELTYTLRKLGFAIKEVLVPKTEIMPLEELRSDVKKSPVIIGPVNMGFLRYNPNYKFLSGSDHFILAYEPNDKGLFIHDPAGYPFVFVTWDDFTKCWESQHIPYGNKEYRYWTQPRRESNPTARQIYKQTIKDFQSIYTNCDRITTENNWITGSAAINKCMERVKGKENKYDELEILEYFSLPLAARMSVDLSKYFEPYNSSLSLIKIDEAKQFGLAQTYAMKNNRRAFCNALTTISKLETDFRRSVLNL